MNAAMTTNGEREIKKPNFFIIMKKRGQKNKNGDLIRFVALFLCVIFITGSAVVDAESFQGAEPSRNVHFQALRRRC